MLGSGVVGLTSARELQRHGFDVTIYAATVPPDTTSNMSLAGWTPTSGLVDTDKRTDAWDAQCRQAAAIAYRRLQLLAGPEVRHLLDHELLADGQRAGRRRRWRWRCAAPRGPLLPATHARARGIVLQPGEHPFPTKYAIERTEMRIEPSIYLDALMNDFLLWGGKVVIRKFETPRDVAALQRERHRQLHRPRIEGALQRSRADAAEGPAGGADAAAGDHLFDERRRPGIAAGRRLHPHDAAHRRHRPRRHVDCATTGRTTVNENERQRIVDAHIELFDLMTADDIEASRRYGIRASRRQCFERSSGTARTVDQTNH